MVMNWTFGTGSDAFPSESGLPARTEEREAGGTLVPSSGAWPNSGMGPPTAFLTLSTSDWPSDASVCSLSGILETGDVPQRYYLSARACRGILRRAERRCKTLPEALETALRAICALEK